MTMISENWGRLLLPGLRKIWHTSVRDREEMFKRSSIFNVQGSSLAAEDFQGIGELGVDGWNEFERTGRVPYAGFKPVWLTTLRHGEYAKGLTVERKLLDDNQYPAAGIPNAVQSEVRKLARSATLFRELAGASVFNYAFTDSGVDNILGKSVQGADGVGLCSTAHPHGPDNATTQSNEGTQTFGASGVAATRTAMSEFTDDKGQLIASHPDTWLVPPELEDAALILSTSEQVTGSANNDVNVHRGRYNVEVWDYLTDANAWFMIDKALRSEHLIWLDRVALEFALTEDFDTLQTKYRAYNRFSRGWDDYRWVYGNNPS